MCPAGGYGRHDLGAERHRRAHQALTVGPGDQHTELVAEGDELALGRPPLVAGLAVAGRRHERRPHAPCRAGAQHLRVRRRRRAHERQVGTAVGEVGDVGDGVDAEHRLALAVGGVDAAGEAARQQVVQRHEAELAGVARRADDHHAGRFEQGAELLARGARSHGGGTNRRRADLDQRVDGDDGSRRRDDERVDVDAQHLGPLDGEASEGDEHRDELATVDRRLAPERPEQRGGRQLVDHLRSGQRIERCRAEHHVGERLGEHAAHAEHHAGPELRVAHDAGDQLALPRSPCWRRAVTRRRRRRTRRRADRRPRPARPARRRGAGARASARSCGRCGRR